MGTRQTTIRFPERTDQQLEDLMPLFGDRTKTVVVAIDRLHNHEILRSMSSLEKAAWCAHRISVLEAIARDVDYYPSSAILSELGGTQNNLPDGASALFGYDTLYGISSDILRRIETLKRRLLAQPQPSLGDNDPAFEIVRHIRNRWYGQRENNAYPNDTAECILAKNPYPYYLP